MMIDNPKTKILVFSQNLKLYSLENLKEIIKDSEQIVCLTTNELFDYETDYIKTLFPSVIFIIYAEMLDDQELERCDIDGYSDKFLSVHDYWKNVKKIKNEKIAEKVLNKYPNYEGYLLSANNDLGICDEVWLSRDFKKINMEYYYSEPYGKKQAIRAKLAAVKPLKALYHLVKPSANPYEHVFEAHYHDKKLIFIGRMHRIDYRMAVEFKPSEIERENLKNRIYHPAQECIYLSTLHEEFNCDIPQTNNYDIRIIQDGYLPPNYSNLYLRFKPNNAKYYAWDALGKELFIKQEVPVEIMPFRKKLYLPEPIFSAKVAKVLITTSGAGDWTALKNRSDDDKLIKIFVEAARRMPEVQFVYRCHPTWIHPQHAGVNSIHRLVEYVSKANLPNLKVSSNIPVANENGFILSFARSSLKEDLEGVDLLFGEHSAAMIDAALDGIPFGTVNCTNRRNLAIGLTNMGFPSCKNVEDVCKLIENYIRDEFQGNYRKAVKNYNEMTDREE